MILAEIGRALGQIGDPAFRRVLALGLGLTVALLVAACIAAAALAGWLVPDTLSLPVIGDVGAGVGALASSLSVVAVLALSVVLMVPVASAFTGIFLDTVAAAVEARHYPHLPPARSVPIAVALSDSLRFLGLMLVANLLALVLYLAIPPAAPLIFWGLNGFLLGREYFQLVAIRRLDRVAAQQLRRRHAGQIWIAGALMAIPLTVPIVNLAVPIVGAASFTHLFHRLAGPTAGAR